MAAIYDDVEIEDMDYDEEKQMFFYPCPCGDKFFITLVRGPTATLFVWLIELRSPFLIWAPAGWCLPPAGRSTEW